MKTFVSVLWSSSGSENFPARRTRIPAALWLGPSEDDYGRSPSKNMFDERRVLPIAIENYHKSYDLLLTLDLWLDKSS